MILYLNIDIWGQVLSSLKSENAFQKYLFPNTWQNKPFILMAELLQKNNYKPFVVFNKDQQSLK